MNKYIISSAFLTLLILLGGCSIDNNKINPNISPNISENQDIIDESVTEGTEEAESDQENKDNTNEVTEDSVKSNDTSVVVTTTINRNEQGMIQTCPEAWYDNRMPTIVEDSTKPQPIRQYFIIGGDRYELNEVDVSWVKESCTITSPTVVY